MGVSAKLQQQWVDDHTATNTQQACTHRKASQGTAGVVCLTPCISMHGELSFPRRTLLRIGKRHCIAPAASGAPAMQPEMRVMTAERMSCESVHAGASLYTLANMGCSRRCCALAFLRALTCRHMPQSAASHDTVARRVLGTIAQSPAALTAG